GECSSLHLSLTSRQKALKLDTLVLIDDLLSFRGVPRLVVLRVPTVGNDGDDIEPGDIKDIGATKLRGFGWTRCGGKECDPECTSQEKIPHTLHDHLASSSSALSGPDFTESSIKP